MEMYISNIVNINNINNVIWPGKFTLIFLIDNLETPRLIFLFNKEHVMFVFCESINVMVMLNIKSDITKSSRVWKFKKVYVH